MNSQTITEYKKHLNKPDERYECELLYRQNDYLVIKYDVTEDRNIGPVEIPAGAVTVAHYWSDRAYVLWKMYDPERDLIGYCYHLCTPPEIDAESVTYLDLLLDAWIEPDGEVTILDVDEFEQAIADGSLSRAQRELAHTTLQTIEPNHDDVLEGLWRPPDGIEDL